MLNIYIRESVDDEELIKIKKIPKYIKYFIIKIIKKLNIIIEYNSKSINNTEVNNDNKLNKMDQLKNINNFNKNYKIYIIPNIFKKNISKKIKNKIKIHKEEKQLILSKKLKNIIKIENIRVLDGKKVIIYAINNILEYLSNIAKFNLEFQDIYILQNKQNLDTIPMIEYLSDKVKTINIVTQNIKAYKKIEEKFYEKSIFLTVSNNKNKSLKRAKIIINVDFSKEELLKYNINRNCIIINLTTEKIDKINSFEGIIINNIEIELKQQIKDYFDELKIYNLFSNIELYESVCKNENYTKQVKKANENINKVIKLIGNNGKISEKELIFNKIFLTNEQN